MDASAHLQVTKGEGYVPSARVAEALEELAASMVAETEAIGDEVTGHAEPRPAVGKQFDVVEFRARIGSPKLQAFCLGIYDDSDGTPLCVGVYSP